MAAKNDSVVTLRHIAERADVSRMTVSLALREDPRIRETTRLRVQKVARDLGYRPDPAWSKMMAAMASPKRGTGVIGYIRSGPRKEWEAIERIFFEALEKPAERCGYCVEPFLILEPGIDPRRINEIMRNRGIEALIIPSIHPETYDQGVRTLPVEWQNFSVVEIADTILQPKLNGVRHNHFDGMSRALSELEALGYRRIGFCMEAHCDLRTHHRWTGAYLTWREMRGFSNELIPLFPNEIDSKTLVEWSERAGLDAIVSPGVDVLRALESEGVRFPDDLGFATLDRWGKQVATVSGIDQNPIAQARIAVDMLIDLVHRGARGALDPPIRATDPGSWHHGKTTRPPGPDHEVRMIDNEPIDFSHGKPIC